MKTELKYSYRQAAIEANLLRLHYSEKYACGILLCLLLFIPLSALAADIMPFLEFDPSDTDNLQDTVIRLNTSIWRAGVREEFRTGANYFVKDDLSINIAMQYLHLSSSAISMPNNGVNIVGCFLGVQWFF